MGDHRTEVLVEIGPEPGTEARELDELTTRLRRRLLEVDVEDVSSPRLEAPPGARGVDAAAVGSLVIKAVTSSKVLAAIIRSIRSWLSGHHTRSVRLEIEGDTIEVTGVSSAGQERLIEAWIERHTEG